MRALNIRGDYADAYAVFAAKTYPLGTRMHLPDRRVFRYALAGASALTVARVLQSARQDEALVDVPIASGRTNARVLPLHLNSAKSIPARTYESGLLYVNDGTGEGYVYPVADNTPLYPGSANAQLLVYLDVDFYTTPVSSTRVTLLRNRYSAVTQADNPPRSAVVGITSVAVPVSNYFWLQTSGPVAALQQDDLEVYLPVRASHVTSGAVELATTTVPTNVLSERYSEDAIVVENALGDEGGPANRRISRRSGIGVVSSIEIGYVLNAREHGQHCLVQLTLE